MRNKIIIGNWKMNLSLADAQDLVFKLKSSIKGTQSTEVAICPSSIYLFTIINILKDTPHIKVGAQNMFYKEEGAYTGEISPKMLKDLHIEMVIIGHSERRQYFNESNKDTNLKIKAALLVAVPNPQNPIFPTQAVGFEALPMRRLPFESIVIASTNDPYGGIRYSKKCALIWGSDIVNIGDAGHINSSSGLGAWPEGHKILQQLQINQTA